MTGALQGTNPALCREFIPKGAERRPVPLGAADSVLGVMLLPQFPADGAARAASTVWGNRVWRFWGWQGQAEHNERRKSWSCLREEQETVRELGLQETTVLAWRTPWRVPGHSRLRASANRPWLQQ